VRVEIYTVSLHSWNTKNTCIAIHSVTLGKDTRGRHDSCIVYIAPDSTAQHDYSTTMMTDQIREFRIFTVRRCASTVYVVGLCPSVYLSAFTSQHCIKTAKLTCRITQISSQWDSSRFLLPKMSINQPNIPLYPRNSIQDTA